MSTHYVLHFTEPAEGVNLFEKKASIYMERCLTSDVKKVFDIKESLGAETHISNTGSNLAIFKNA